MAALSLMPIWLFMYVRSLTEAPEVASGPLGVGAEVYSSCQSCHGAGGEGGSGRVFAGGEVLETFPHIEDQLRFVYFAPPTTTSTGSPSTGTPTARAAHTRPDRWDRCRPGAPTPVES